MTIDYRVIGSQLQAGRVKRDLTQADVAKKVGVTAAAISAIERGTSRPNLERIERIAEVVGLEMRFELVDPRDPDSRLSSRFEAILPRLTEEARSTLIVLLSMWETKLAERAR